MKQHELKPTNTEPENKIEQATTQNTANIPQEALLLDPFAPENLRLS